MAENDQQSRPEPQPSEPVTPTEPDPRLVEILERDSKPDGEER